MARRHEMMTPPPAAPRQPAAAQASYVAELEELARLKQRGLLTDAEYEAKKKQILGI